MNTLQLALILLAAILSLSSGLYYYGRMVKSRRNANFLDRLGTESRFGVFSQGERLAKNRAMQMFLNDLPGVEQLAALLEAAGQGATVASLLGKSLLYFFGSMVVLRGVLHLALFPVLLLSLMAICIPTVLVVRIRNKRAAAFEAQLPQALELIALYLRTGRSLPQALGGTVNDLKPPASEEFALAAEEYRLGRPLDVALKRLASKFPRSLGFRLFAIASSVLGQTGGNLVEVLERIKRGLDAAIKFDLRVRALTGEARSSATILGSLPAVFLLILAVMSPDYLLIFFNDRMGNVFFALLVISWSSGLLWMRSLLKSRI